MDWTVNLVSLAAYVLQAIGLYTIAKRRGIKYAWLAWVPVGCVWILGSISDDFKARTTGRPRNKRKALVILTAVLAVLYILVLIASFRTMFKIFDFEEMVELAQLAGEVGDGMYDISEEEFAERIVEIVETNLTDDMLPDLMAGAIGIALLGLVSLGVGVAAAVIEWICILDLYESCEPAKKTLYFVLSLIFGIQGVFIFLCREKDVIPPAALPSKEPWEN